MPQKLALIALAGGLGTLARYGLSGLVQKSVDGEFPWGTVAVNLFGCFLFGVLFSLADSRTSISGETRIILLTGFMGAFTTFSTFVYETAEMLRLSQWWLAASNMALQNFVGIIALLVGMALGRLL